MWAEEVICCKWCTARDLRWKYIWILALLLISHVKLVRLLKLFGLYMYMKINESRHIKELVQWLTHSKDEKVRHSWGQVTFLKVTLLGYKTSQWKSLLLCAKRKAKLTGDEYIETYSYLENIMWPEEWVVSRKTGNSRINMERFQCRNMI